MNQVVNEADLVSAVPLAEPVKTMTRREKLLHWASIVRKCQSTLYIFHRLEHWDRARLDAPGYYATDMNAFALALNDPAFNAMGLKSETQTGGVRTGTVGQVMGFFELSQQELHEFSCDCGGHIGNEDMANRIEGIANRGGGSSQPVGTITASVNGAVRSVTSVIINGISVRR